MIIQPKKPKEATKRDKEVNFESLVYNSGPIVVKNKRINELSTKYTKKPQRTLRKKILENLAQPLRPSWLKCRDENICKRSKEAIKERMNE